MEDPHVSSLDAELEALGGDLTGALEELRCWTTTASSGGRT
jgi:hypothetical protein